MEVHVQELRKEGSAPAGREVDLGADQAWPSLRSLQEGALRDVRAYIRGLDLG